MLKIEFVREDHPDLAELIGRLDTELLERYPPEEVFGLAADSEIRKRTIFAVAYFDQIPAGCGAIQPLDPDTAELKRFFVDKAMRKRGIATALLSRLEGQARLRQYRTVKLETGVHQPESIGLYEKCGYTPIPKYGPYQACETSLCYSKSLST